VLAFVAQVTRVAVEDAWRRVEADLEQPTREFPDVAGSRPGPDRWIESMDIQKALASFVLWAGGDSPVSWTEPVTRRLLPFLQQAVPLARLRTLLQ